MIIDQMTIIVTVGMAGMIVAVLWLGNKVSKKLDLIVAHTQKTSSHMKGIKHEIRNTSGALPIIGDNTFDPDATQHIPTTHIRKAASSYNLPIASTSQRS